MTEMHVDMEKRTVYARMSGVFTEKDMRDWAKEYRTQSTHAFRSRRHIVIADMRGMRTLALPVAEILREEIAHARKHGVALCIHLTDEAVQRLQVARVARQSSAEDDVTIDVSSLDEAHRVADEVRERLDDPKIVGSLRDTIRSPK